MTDRFDLVVFDWDGTLMDSIAKIVNCFRAALADVGLPELSDAAIRHIIGLGLSEAVHALLPQTDAATRARVVERYREHFLHLDSTQMPLFPGVIAGLERLAGAGFQLAVATGKARRGLQRVLDHTATAHLFCATRCADEAASKPHPRMLHDILTSTGVPAERALMVGDTTYDLLMADAAGMPSLAVSYGVHSRERLLEHRPRACLDSFAEVCGWLHARRAAMAVAGAGQGPDNRQE